MSIDLRRFAILPAVVLAAACSSGGEETGETLPTAPGAHRIEITATDSGFTPSRIRVSPNEVVQFIIRNHGTSPHAVAFEFPHVRARLDGRVQPGKTVEMLLVTPPEPGTYAFYSPLGDDQIRGLIGNLIVELPHTIKPFHTLGEAADDADATPGE